MKKTTLLTITVCILVLGFASAWMKLGPSEVGKMAGRSGWDKAIKLARVPISASMKDPSSVQFRGEVLQADGVTVCGEFNAKNSFGGYVGFVKYASNSRHFIIENGGFKTWPVQAMPVVTPDGYADAVEKASTNPDLMIMIRRDLWDWYWNSLCKSK